LINITCQFLTAPNMTLEHSYTAKYEVTKIIRKFPMINDHALMIHYEKYDQ